MVVASLDSSDGANRAQAQEERFDPSRRVMGQPLDNHRHHGGK